MTTAGAEGGALGGCASAGRFVYLWRVLARQADVAEIPTVGEVDIRVTSIPAVVS